MMAKTLRNIITALFVLLGKYLEDIFIIGGIGVIVATTYGWNVTAGNYLLGAVLILFGLILAKRG